MNASSPFPLAQATPVLHQPANLPTPQVATAANPRQPVPGTTMNPPPNGIYWIKPKTAQSKPSYNKWNPGTTIPNLGALFPHSSKYDYISIIQHDTVRDFPKEVTIDVQSDTILHITLPTLADFCLDSGAASSVVRDNQFSLFVGLATQNLE